MHESKSGQRALTQLKWFANQTIFRKIKTVLLPEKEEELTPAPDLVGKLSRSFGCLIIFDDKFLLIRFVDMAGEWHDYPFLGAHWCWDVWARRKVAENR